MLASERVRSLLPWWEKARMRGIRESPKDCAQASLCWYDERSRPLADESRISDD